MRLLIVGCGYVGMALGAEMVRRGHQVFGLRRNASAAAKLKAAGIEPLTADFTTPGALKSLAGPFNWVVNTASSSGGEAAAYRQVYLEGMQRLVEWLADMPARKIVYTSSTGVYGRNDGAEVDESTPPEPANDTGHVLLEAEKVLRASRLPAVILRVAGIYGPGRGYYFKQFLSGQPLPGGDVQRWLNMIHRDDVAGVIASALEHEPVNGTYIAVDDEPVRYGDFIRWLATETGRPMPPEPGGQAAFASRAPTNKRLLNARLKRDFGYVFRYPTFREGYREAVAAVKVQERPA